METLAFPEVLCERLGHRLGCSFAHTPAKSGLGGPLGPALHVFPWHRRDGDVESSRNEFIPLFWLMKDISNMAESLLKASVPGSQLFGEDLLQTRLTDMLAVEHRNITVCSKCKQKGSH